MHSNLYYSYLIGGEHSLTKADDHKPHISFSTLSLAVFVVKSGSVGLRNWVKYGLKQSKSELGWADFRVTDYSQISKWWEIIMSVYLMVSLHAQVLNNPSEPA